MSDLNGNFSIPSRSTKRTGSIVVSRTEIDRDTYDKVSINDDNSSSNGTNNTINKQKITKKRASRSIQDIETGSLLDLQIKNANNDDEKKSNSNNNNHSNNQLNKPVINGDNNNNNNNSNNYNSNSSHSAYDFVRGVSNSNYIGSNSDDNTTNPSILSSNNPSVYSIGSSIFHPNKFVGNSKFASPQSTVSNAATVDPLDKLNGMDELNHYDKHKELGTGTDAFVYEVVDRRDKSHVAMKLTKRKSGRYRTEIHLLYQLRTCPFIVKLLKVLEDDSVYVLILEQAPMTLEMLLHERCTEISMQERVSKEIINDVFKGLKSIHNLGFVHKDMKPENVLIFADRQRRKLQAKIADFGFATRCELTNNQNKGKKKIKLSPNQLNEFIERVCDKCGTPGFWAPELVAECVQLEEAFKMDVFSCGVTLYRMLCNEMPFGLFESWELKKDNTNNDVNIKPKLAKMKPNFQIVSWMRVKKNNKPKNGSNKHKYNYIRKLSKQKLTQNAEDLLRGMLRIRPHKRLTIEECLKHKWLKKDNNIH